MPRTSTNRSKPSLGIATLVALLFLAIAAPAFSSGAPDSASLVARLDQTASATYAWAQQVTRGLKLAYEIRTFLNQADVQAEAAAAAPVAQPASQCPLTAVSLRTLKR